MTKEFKNIIDWELFDSESFSDATEDILKIADELADRIQENKRIIFASIGLISDIVKGLSHDIDYHFSFSHANTISLNNGLCYSGLHADWKKLGEVGPASVVDLMDIDLNEDDVVIGISSSSETSYVMTALDYASEITNKTYLITNRNKAEVKTSANNIISVEVNNDPINIGSFSGVTLTKLIIDKIFYIAMIKAGRVYKGRSLFKKWNYENKIDEIIKTLQYVTDKPYDECLEVFNQSGKVTQIAATMLLKNVSKDEAIDMLDRNKNNFNKILN